MPHSTIDWENRLLNPLITEQLNYNMDEEAELARTKYQACNIEQRHAFDEITQSVMQSLGRLFFLHGPAGTGKTFVYNTVCNFVRSLGSIVLCVASSGIAALLLTGGRTAHSMFKIPIDDLSSQSFCNISKKTHRAELLKRTSLIIWDEAGAQHRHAIEAVDNTCRDICELDCPFGGITVVFGGDFQQTLPIVPKGSRADITFACIQSSYFWPSVSILHLRENMRLHTGDGPDHAFAQWLLDIGRGASLPPGEDTGDVNLPSEILTYNSNDLKSFIYHGVDSSLPPLPEYFLNRSILAARNTDVSSSNDDILSRMSGDVHTYISADSVVQEQGADSTEYTLAIPPEFLRSINSSSLPPGELYLKIGCPIILLRNLTPADGLCNGTRMVILQLESRVIEAMVIGGDHHGTTAFIPRISLMPSDTTDVAFKFKRRQFPIRLAFAMSINKAQGQSIKHVGLDLRIPVFAHGQLYVALSRATSRRSIRILLPESTSSSNTHNVVYRDVLL